jgi:hypothetical protein
MENARGVSVPRWFRIVSVLALIWMLFGILSFVMDPLTSEATLAEMSETHRQLFEARPLWLFVVYGVSVFSGLAGAVGLVMRKVWAVHAFAVSLVFIVIQFVYVLFVMDAVGLLGAAEALPFPMVIFTIGALLLWLSVRARQQGWIGTAPSA